MLGIKSSAKFMHEPDDKPTEKANASVERKDV